MYGARVVVGANVAVVGAYVDVLVHVCMTLW